MYKFKFTKRAQKDSELLKQAGLQNKTEKLLKEIISTPADPPSKKMCGNMNGKYSRRINLKHRIVYEIFEEIKVVKVLRMWSHYEM